MATLRPPLLQGYLARVGLPSDLPLPPPTLCTLARLHNAHLRAVPFENLSLKLDAAAQQHGIDTDLQAVYNKIVVSRRGGYCFEQNGLFGAVLRSLGFSVIDAAARVVQGTTEEPAAVERLAGNHEAAEVVHPKLELRLSGHDHHILLVSMAGQPGGPPRLWLTDCGFGGECLPLPLVLPEGAERYAAPAETSESGGGQGPAGTALPGTAAAEACYAGQPWADDLPVGRLARYRLRLGLPGLLAAPDPGATLHYAQRAGYYLQHWSVSSGAWKDLYFFRLDEFLPQDYAMQNHYIKENPASHFRQNLVAALHTPEGRVTLLNDSFRVWRDGEAAPAEEQAVRDEEHLLTILDTHFGITL